jgi:hypothetical protein
MVTDVAARAPLPLATAVASWTGVLHRLMVTGALAGSPVAETLTEDPGVAWSGLTVTAGVVVAPPVGQVAAGDVVDVVDPEVVLVVDPPPPVVDVVDPPPPVVEVVDPPVVDVVEAGAPNGVFM